MSIEVTRVDANHIILHDGLTLVVSESENYKIHNGRIKEDMAKAIYKKLTSFDIALALAKNYVNKPALQTYVIDDGVSELEDLTTAVLDLNNGSRLESATLFVSSDVGAVAITGKTLLDVVRIMKDAGAEADPTFGKYSRIKLTIDVPSTNTMEDGVVYVLSNDYKDYSANTAFVVVREGDEVTRNILDTKTGDLTPTAYGNPMDRDTYPQYDDDNTVSGSIGSSDSNTVEVAGQNIIEPATITASDNVNIVNTGLSEGTIKITIA